MRKVIFGLPVILLASALAEARQDASAKRGFFSEKRVDFWRDGSADRKPATDSNASASESIWAEPIRLQDGRYTTYVPPRQVLEFLENPTRENALKYVEWQTQRMDKMRKAAAMLAEVNREKSGKETQDKPLTDDPVAITYFKKAS